MLKRELIPTQLISPTERPPVVIAPVRSPSRFRTFVFIYRLALLWLLARWLQLTRRFKPAQYGRHVRAFLAGAGTVWLKFGQVMAMRSDLVLAEFAAELAELRDRGAGVPFTHIREAVERELGAPLEQHFDEFSETPFATTTSFQLHRARLRREKVWVAVKVLHPFSEQTFERDLDLLRRVTQWLVYLRVYPKMRWTLLAAEVEELARRELDLRFEASALRQLASNLPPHGVYAPEVYGSYSSRRVLVMEFIHAALMADYIHLKQSDPARLEAWLKENNIEPRKLARRMFFSIWRQIFEDNLFHADMHPGNIILLRDSRLAVIDCRSVGQLELESLGKHRRFVEALADGDYATAAEYSFLLASRLPRVDLGEVKTQFVRHWRRWETRSYVRALPPAEKSITLMLDGLNRIMYRHGFESQWELARFARALTNADLCILQLAADVNYLQWMRHYFREAGRRRNRIRLQELINRAVVNTIAFAELPKLLSGESIAQQEILRRQARVYQSSTSKSGDVLATAYSLLGSAVALATALLGCAFLRQRGWEDVVEPLGPQLAALLNLIPPLGMGEWLGVFVLAGFLYRRMVTGQRSYRKRDVVRRPDARPAI